MLVDIAEKQGIYFAVALLYDSSYDLDRIRKLLPVLEAQKGAVKASEGVHGQSLCCGWDVNQIAYATYVYTQEHPSSMLPPTIKSLMLIKRWWEQSGYAEPEASNNVLREYYIWAEECFCKGK